MLCMPMCAMLGAGGAMLGAGGEGSICCDARNIYSPPQVFTVPRHVIFMHISWHPTGHEKCIHKTKNTLASAPEQH